MNRYSKLKNDFLNLIQESKIIDRIKTDETRKSIESAWKNCQIPDEGDSDYLDMRSIKYLERILKNPYIIPTGSCSGGKHSGYPYLSFVIIDRKGEKYVNRLRKLGYELDLSSNMRLSYFKMNYPKSKIKKEWNIGLEDNYSISKSIEFWENITSILEKV